MAGNSNSTDNEVDSYDLVFPLKLAPHLPERGVAAVRWLDVTARYV
jgi:hypothetical protein